MYSLLHMKEHEGCFLESLKLVTVSELTRATTRSRSAWDKYARGERRITPGAARELADYLRVRSESFAQAAAALDALARKEES